MAVKTVRLRALEPEDIDLIYRWENDPSVWDSSAEHVPFSRHRLTDYLLGPALNSIASSGQLRLVAVNGSRPVGCVDLFDYDPVNQRAGVGILIDSSLRGIGYGSAALRQLVHYASRHLLLHQLHCEVAASNTPSIRLFQHAGFSQVGCRPQWLRRPSGWEDVLIFHLLLGE